MARTAKLLSCILFFSASACTCASAGQLDFSGLSGKRLTELAAQAKMPAPPAPEKSLRAGAQLCCNDAASCGKIKSEGLAAPYGPAVLAFRALSEGRWYLTFEDGAALTDGSVGSLFLSRKDLAGSYEFNVKKMSVINSWNSDPAINISRPGSTEKRIGRICFTADKLNVSASNAEFAIAAAPKEGVKVMPSPNSGTPDGQPAIRKGYAVTTDYGRYLFSSAGK